jgi:hypothetical protein
MSCAAHHSCPCRQDLMIDLEESLRMMVRGVESYMKTLKPHEVHAFREHVHNLETARSAIHIASKF